MSAFNIGDRVEHVRRPKIEGVVRATFGTWCWVEWRGERGAPSSACTWDLRPWNPVARYVVEYRAPKAGERYFGTGVATVILTAQEDYYDFGRLRAVIVEELS